VRQSNSYIIIYAAALTIVCALALAFASIILKDKQEANISRERKMNILATVIKLEEGADVEAIYEKRIRAYVVDFDGNIKNDLPVDKVVIAEEYKKPAKDRLLPVYEVKSESNPDKIEFTVLPVYGFGLWNNIWGFVALKSDFNSVQGAKFQHAGETPGLGARIESDEIQARYANKKIFENGEVVSIFMQKGEGSSDYSGDTHKVDGMSGATLTGKGVNNMLKDYLTCYQNYLKKNQSSVN
jgi:Na+-transporting NADH:ubiquinone oxidoreductase subunit C